MDSICLNCGQEYMASCGNDRRHHILKECTDPDYELKRQEYWDEVNAMARRDKEAYDQGNHPLTKLLESLL